MYVSLASEVGGEPRERLPRSGRDGKCQTESPFRNSLGYVCAGPRSPCHGRSDTRFLVNLQFERPRHSRSLAISSTANVQLQGLACTLDSGDLLAALPFTFRISGSLLAANLLSAVGRRRGSAECHSAHRQFYLFSSLDARGLQLAYPPACGHLSSRQFAGP